MTTPPNGVSYRLGRLEEDIDRLSRRIETISDTVARRAETVAEIRAAVDVVTREARECNVNVTKLSDTLNKRAENQRLERRADRRWLVGTVLTSAGLVIAALALLVDKI